MSRRISWIRTFIGGWEPMIVVSGLCCTVVTCRSVVKHPTSVSDYLT